MRTAVSNSCEFIRKPPSPVTATTRRFGCTSLAATAPGTAMPMAAKPLEMMQVLGCKAREEARQPQFVRAHVRDDDVVVGQRRAEVGEDSLRLEREGVVVTALLQFVAQHLAEGQSDALPGCGVARCASASSDEAMSPTTPTSTM